MNTLDRDPLYPTFLVRAVQTLGFAVAPYDLSDRRPVNFHYLHRLHEGQHQWLSLCYAPHNAHQFCEAVIEVFHVPRNPKARRAGKLRDQQLKGAAALYTNLARDWETIERMVGQVYPLAKDTP